MKKSLKKLTVLLMAVAMMITSMSFTAFGADPNTSFEVKGLKENKVTATAYRIVEMDAQGRTKVAAGLTINDVNAPTEEEILAIAAKDLTGGKAGSIVADGDDYKAVFSNVEPGLYLVKFQAAENAEYIYNPVIVGINNDASKDTWANLKVSDKFNNTGYVKSSKIPFDKVVDRDADKNGNKDSNKDNASVTNDDEKGDTAALGEKVWFRINTTLPAYANNYFKQYNDNINVDPVFEINDTLSKGLDLNGGDLAVYYKDGNEWKAIAAEDATITKQPRSFKVEFTTAGLLKLRGKEIEVRYSATVNGEHGYNFDGEKNEATYKYTRNPGEAGKPGEGKKTYHYTFTVNGEVDGPDSDENREIIKVGVDENGNYITQETTNKEEKGWKPLSGAEFKLYYADGAKKDQEVRANMNIHSDENGIIRGIDRIDAGKYYLVETKAPEGYAKNETKVYIDIDATLDDLGRLVEYEVKVGKDANNMASVGKYQKSYDNAQQEGVANVGTISYPNKIGENGRTVKYMVDGKEVTKADFDEACNLNNSKVGTLPSTGGMGTILFTIAGIAIMAIAAGLFIANRKASK